MNVKYEIRGFLIAHPWARTLAQPIRDLRQMVKQDNPFWFLRYLQAPDNTIIVDAGANVGQSIRSIRRVDQATPIHAFEPALASYEKLRKNVANSKGVKLYQTALLDANGDFTLYTPEYGGRAIGELASINRDEAALWLSRFAGSFINPRKVTVKEEKVVTAKLDEYNLAPRFIKIDVQGVVPQLLRGAEATLEAYRPVLYVERGKNDGVGEQLSQFSYREYALKGGSLMPYRGEKDAIMISEASDAKLHLPFQN